LINGTPSVLELTVDFQVHLTQVPGTSNWPAAPTQSCGICASQLVAPLAHGFEAHSEAAFSHSELDIAITQAEANIQPNTLVDHVHGEPMAGVAALRKRRVLAAQLRSRNNAVVGASLLIKRSRPLEVRVQVAAGTALRSWSRVRTVYASEVRIVAGSEIGIEPMTSRKHRGY
jgi:hypothetical protein